MKLDGFSGKRPFALAAATICLLGLLNALGSVGRPFWMDEAITIMSFTTRPTLLSTYLAYEIPNNHIVYTMLLSLWMDLAELAGANFSAFLRLPSLLFGLGALLALFAAFRRKGSFEASATLCAFFAMSCSFAIYATALRGYMLSILCVALAVWLSPWLLRRGRLWRFAAYFALCLLAAGTIPTNVLALEALALASIGRFPPGRLARSLWLFAAPPAALAVFYLPILPKFLKCMSLDEGWPSTGSALANVYFGFALAFLPLIPLGVRGAFLLWRRRPAKRLGLFLGLCLFALPLALELLAKNPPFPRVFLPLWPVWLLSLARPLGLAFSEFGRRFPGLKPLTFAGLLLCLWAAVEYKAREPLRDAFFKDGRRDDLFLPHYAETSYRPDLLVKKLAELRAETPSSQCFVSFNADNYACILQGNLAGLPEGFWLCDSPKRGKIQALPEDLPLLLVCSGKDDLEATLSRFGREGALLLQDFGFQQLYSLPPKSKL